MRRRVRCIAALLALLSLTGACKPDTVRVAFRPAADARYRYAVEVRSEAETQIADREPRRTVDRFLLQAEHDILEAGPQSSTVEIRLERADIGTRTFVARLDRAGQLAEVERIEGLPAQVLGELGISEIFPAAAGAPPDRPLSPGDRWTIDAPVDLPGLAPGRLRGRGRLTALGVVDGREVATIESVVDLTVPQGVVDAGGRFVLGGTQSTTSTATHSLADGAVQEVRAVTRGRFDLTVLPPEGTAGPSVPGTLVVEVRSHTRRVD